MLIRFTRCIVRFWCKTCSGTGSGANAGMNQQMSDNSFNA